jgi:N-acetylgalactosamine 4-sulfate 6-O-sulfotransferase
VAAFRACERNFTRDDCALRFESLARVNEEFFYHCDQLIKGIYSVFLREWLREHPRRLLALRAEENYASPTTTLARALRYLGLPVPADEAGWRPLLDLPKQLHYSRPKGGAPPMLAATAAALAEFYAPSLCELVALLRNDGATDAAEWQAWVASGPARAHAPSC